ncbi:MAG: hypothetical protein ACREE6_11400, partial [Limisphaerales bacterium]
AIDCRPQRQNFAVGNGKILPSATAINCHEGRQAVAVAHGNRLPLPTANGCRGERQETADKREPKDVSLRDQKGSFKRSTDLNALKKGGAAKKISAENAFLADVSEVMDQWKPGHGKFELTNSGAAWRGYYRADSDLIARVLAETRCMIIERKIKTTPGQVAMDLWKRWSLDRLRNVLKQKAAAKAAART